MTDERWKQLMSQENEPLLHEEIVQGWHWCPDWDDLLVGPGMELELTCCHCKLSAAATTERKPE